MGRYTLPVFDYRLPFFNMPKTSSGVFERGGVLFFMLLFNALLALAELSAAFSSRPILLKHKTLLVFPFLWLYHSLTI